MESMIFSPSVVYLEQRNTEWPGDVGAPRTVTREVSSPMCSKRITPTFPDPNPSGLCFCGCGGRTSIAQYSKARKGWVAGKPVRYIAGHQHGPRPSDPNPSGICLCGCGQKTSIAESSDTKRGYLRGAAHKFVLGHRKQIFDCSYSVEDHGYVTPCWIWHGTLNTDHYFMTKARGVNEPAHRMMYERHVGSIPENHQLDHLCRVHACVNPEHLQPVTIAENVRRGVVARITREDAALIKALCQTKGTTEVAEIMGYSISLVAHVKDRRSWKDIEPSMGGGE